MIEPVLRASLLAKAREKQLVSYHLTQIRDFATDRHRTVDDTPYGGGAGMLLRADVLYRAWRHALPRRPKPGGSRKGPITVLLSPQGEVFNQALARELAPRSKIVFVCGHYEGVDERFIELCVDRQISIGDYVLTGGEIAAAAIADTVIRLIPGVVGNPSSLTDETFENGLLKYPQYTRPREFQGLEVPDVLLGGNHRAIAEWRRAEAERRTREKRPDLWEARPRPGRG